MTFVMSEQQQSIYDQLLNEEPIPSAKVKFKRTFGQFVIEYGWWYQPASLPHGIEIGTPQQCHKNAHKFASEEDNFFYCEGFALYKDCRYPTLHAWVTDGLGNAFDNTWEKPGVAYAGVPFKEPFVTMTNLKNHATISLLDDWQNVYPLRGELGDRPDEWYEQRGHGVARLTRQSRDSSWRSES